MTFRTRLPAAFLVLFSSMGPYAIPRKAFDPTTYETKAKPVEVNPDQAPIQLFVAPGGSDSASGRRAVNGPDGGPFATPERARDEIRKLKSAGPLPPGGVAVNLRGGIYRFTNTLVFEARDSGEPGAPVVYRAFHDEPVSWMGGRRLMPADFSKVTDGEKVKRLDPSAVGKLLEMNLKALGFSHTGPFPEVFSDQGGLLEIFVGGTRLPLARWPDVGEATMEEVWTNGEKDRPGSFRFRGERPRRWDARGGFWLKGQWRVGWEDPAIRVASVDGENHLIHFAAGIAGGIGNKYKRPKGSGTEPWHAINLVEEITRPGEWALDFQTGVMTLWPPAGFDGADILVSQLDTPLVSGKDIAHMAFIGLTLENSLGDGFVFSKTQGVLVAACTLRNLAGRGVVLDGLASGVQSCDMYGLGRGCIILSGGDRNTLTESGTYAVNNHLHHYGVLKAQYSAAIDVYSDNKNAPAVGLYIAHNLIHHAPRDAFLFAGNNNLFEYNEVHRCAYDTADSGAFYSWSDWTTRGIIIRYNHLHDTVGGVNPDDGASGTFVYGNVIRGERTGIWLASGPDHQIWNNIFVKPEGPVFAVDERGSSRGYASNARMVNAVKAIRPPEPPWCEVYPEMATFLQDRPEMPRRTHFASNAIWVARGEVILNKLKKENAQNPDFLQVDGNWVSTGDLGFRNPTAGDFSLRDDSPVYREIPGFQKIPFQKIGLEVDRYRKSLPSPREAGRLPEQDPWKTSDTNRNFGT